MGSEIKKEWNEEQNKAIKHSGSNLLLSAGAGSGKTAVLTERVYYLLKNKDAKLDRFLVLTFTKAAASEMKTRIRSRVLKDETLVDLSSDIENSHIETFDAFCLFLAKKYANQLGIARDISPIEGALLKIKRKNIIQEILNEYYEKEDDIFSQFMMSFCTKDDNLIYEVIEKIYSLYSRSFDRKDFRKNFVNRTMSEENYRKQTNDYMSEIKALADEIAKDDKWYSMENTVYAEKAVDYYKQIASLNSYQEFYDFMQVNKLPNRRLKDFKLGPDDKKFADEINDKFFSRYVGGQEKKELVVNPDNAIKEIKKTEGYVKTLFDIFNKMLDKLEAFSREYNCYSHDEIALMCINLLIENENIRKEVANSFDYIMVDEYQDTNDIQEKMLNLIGNKNIFMVGDVKQSIYRFRNADCSIFQKKYDTYKNNDDINGTKIDLNTNYRSRNEIVDDINNIFEQLFIPKFNPIDYSTGHAFKFGNTKDYGEGDNLNQNQKLEVYCYDFNRGNSGHKTGDINKEINLIADDIIEKINNKFTVIDHDDHNNPVSRPVNFKDFAIIIDRGSSFDKFKKELSNRNIPVQVIKNEDISGKDVSSVAKSLLTLYSNVGKEDPNEIELKHSFVSIARSFLFEYSDEKIYQVIKNESHNLSDDEVYQKALKVKNNIKDSSLYGIMSALFDEFSLYEKLAKITHYEENLNRALAFLDIASSMDNLEFSVEDLKQYFSDIDENEEKMEIVANPSTENAVTIINIHKSKGLEYPICYYPCLFKKFVRDSGIRVTNDFGVVLPYLVGSDIRLFDNISKRRDYQADLEEKIRMFYVAYTRAKEKAIIVVPTQKANDDGSVKNISDIRGADSFLKFIYYLKIHQTNGVLMDVKNNQLNQQTVDNPKIELSFDSIAPFGSQEIIKKHASKQRSDDVSDYLLDLGTHIHYLLEIVDYTSKDTSFIKNKKHRQYVDNILNSELFDGVNQDNVLNEYSFFDEVNNINGVIDCLVMRDDYFDIIDFKLKHISDVEYENQLRSYRNYLMTKTDKKIKMHLISAITGEIKEVE